ncbi:hypothetical protein [Neobacillus muris]|uniref:hypothetical protein n=1 Tax=Neobacillus muris TaxID=2941334 RepID=UPI00203A68E8|nr:hypothetical protein [Neobacillus muris]
MFSFRGDAHKVFLQVKRTAENGQPVRNLRDFEEVESIQKLYQSMDSGTLKLIYYRMVKEKNGSGITPIFVTAVPWLLFLFSKPLVDYLFREGSWLWLIFAIIYFTLLITSVILHFREKAWAAFHMEIIQDILSERKAEGLI